MVNFLLQATILALFALIQHYAIFANASPSMNSRKRRVNTIQPTTLSCFTSPLDKIQRDFQALTRRVTAHHILLPKSTDAALALKQKIRNRVNPRPTVDSDSQASKLPSTIDTANENKREGMYIVDAFEQAAQRYSLDIETKENGGLLGTLLPQGALRLVPELDKACFEVPLGVVSGPIETTYGFHLLLVVERTNCPKLDGDYTKIVRGGVDGKKVDFRRSTGKEEGSDMVKLTIQQVGFWIGALFAGGIVAELAAKTADVVERLPWE